MADLDLVDPTATSSSRATDLFADFHARHDAWRRQGENLARLRADARAAAGREAGAILASARADIHRIVRDARRGLLELAAQLQLIDEQGGAQSEPAGQEPDSVLQARRDLQRLLGELRPELDEVAAQVRQFDDPPSPPQAADRAVISVPELDDDVDHEAALAAIAPLFELDEPTESAGPAPVPPASVPPASVAAATGPAATAPAATGPAATGPATTGQATTGPATTATSVSFPVSVPAQPATASHRETPPFGKAGIVTVLAVVGMLVVGGGGWWLSGFLGSRNLTPPLGAIPRAPRVTPSWLDDRAPTLTASLVALPQASTPAALSVEIEVRREAWVQSAIDSDAPTSRIFRAGETARLQGARGISISTRDAGAVVVSVNGGPRVPLGPDGREMTRQFSANDREIASQ